MIINELINRLESLPNIELSYNSDEFDQLEYLDKTTVYLNIDSIQAVDGETSGSRTNNYYLIDYFFDVVLIDRADNHQTLVKCEELRELLKNNLDMSPIGKSGPIEYIDTNFNISHETSIVRTSLSFKISTSEIFGTL
jgi:hypothetical protein